MAIRTAIVFATLMHVCIGIDKWDVFSTKTAYLWAHNLTEPTIDEDYTRSDGAGCSAIHISMVVRHGSRYPTDSATEEISELKEKLLQFADGPRYADLSGWTSPASMELEGQLAPEGVAEMKHISGRLSKRFATLLTDNGQYVKFISSYKDRTKDSSENFHIELKAAFTGIPAFDNEVDNSLTRLDDDCALWERDIDDNEVHFKEFLSYPDTTEFKDIQANLQTKLGINFTLTAEEVYTIYELCAYDKYLTYTTSFWCDLLTDEERLVLEYGQDIENYYQKSYGAAINTELACPLVSDLFHTMDKSINTTWDYADLPQEAIDNGYLAGKFVFGHSDTNVFLATALGLYKDSMDLKANNRAAMLDRKFKSSTIVPYSGNIAFVVYKCSASNGDKSAKIQLYVNEQVVRIPGCDDDLCPYTQVRQHYVDLIDSCDRAKICDIPSGDPNGAASMRIHVAVVLVASVFAFLKFQ